MSPSEVQMTLPRLVKLKPALSTNPLNPSKTNGKFPPLTTYKLTFSNGRYSGMNGATDPLGLPVAGLPTIWNNKPSHRIEVPPPYVPQPAPLPFSYTKRSFQCDGTDDADEDSTDTQQTPETPSHATHPAVYKSVSEFKTPTTQTGNHQIAISKPLPDVIVASHRGVPQRNPRRVSRLSFRSAELKQLPEVTKRSKERPDISWTKRKTNNIDNNRSFNMNKPGWKRTTLTAT